MCVLFVFYYAYCTVARFSGVQQSALNVTAHLNTCLALLIHWDSQRVNLMLTCWTITSPPKITIVIWVNHAHSCSTFVCVCVCVCVLYMHWICCVAVRKDKPSNTRTTHIHLFSLSSSAVSQVCLLCAACRREFWETSVLQLCIYWSCGNVACTLLTDCHTAAFSQCAMLHTVWPAGSFHCCKNQSMKVCDLLWFLCAQRIAPVFTPCCLSVCF